MNRATRYVQAGVSLALLLTARTAIAQDRLDPTLPANSGSFQISPGFQPDPLIMSAYSGGTVDVAALGLGADCVGYASSAPDIEIYLTDRADLLQFYTQSDVDTVLIINDAWGNWICNDDSYGTTDPTITFIGAPAGYYDIWIANYYHADPITYSPLYVTEFPWYHP